VNRGEIWSVDLRSVRYVLIASVPLPNHPNVVVVPLRDDLAVTPTLIAVRDPDTGLIADVASMTGISSKRFVARLRDADPKTLERVEHGMRALLGL
jgi:hypothetical protein